MKKSFKIKKSVVESMVDDAIRSTLKESTESTSYEDSMEKERRFTYGDLSQDVMHWALNYADSGHNQPINAVQCMQEWYNGNDSALDVVCERFAEWKGIECDDNVRSAVEKAALEIGYYENWNGDRIEFDESQEKKDAQSVEDMKRKVKSLSQKVSNADEELPELRSQINTLKNKLSTIKEGLDYEDCFNEWLMDSYGMDLEDFYSLPEDEQQNYYEEYDDSVSMAADDMRDWQREEMMLEHLKSRKLKDFAKQHGGLTDGQWSYGFENDLYNMSDEDFDAYEVVDYDKHYAKYGLNGTDKTGYSNNNFQPLNFGDGTFMVKKNPKFGWDERAKNLMKRRSERREKRKVVSEAKLNCIVSKTIKKVLNEGIYGYPDGIDDIIFLSENDRELYEEYRQIAKACMKLYKKDVQLSLERLTESSIMKRYQQHCFKKYAKEQQGLDRMNSPREFRRFIAEKIIDEVVNGAWDDNEMMNESDIWNLGGYRSKYELEKEEAMAFGKKILDGEFDDRLYDYDWVGRKLSRMSEENAQYIIGCIENRIKKCQKYIVKENTENMRRVWVDSRVPGIGKSWYYGENDEMNLDDLQSLLDKYDASVLYKSNLYDNVYDIPLKSDWHGLSKYGMPDELGRGFEERPTVTIVPKGTKYVKDYFGKRFEFPEGWNEKSHIEKYGVKKPESRLREEIEEPKQYGYQNVNDEFVEKVGENGYEVWVPDWALCYLVNGDTECMDDEDIAKVDKFVETYQDKVEPYVGVCCIPMDGEEPSFRYENSIDKLGADCYRFFLPAKETENLYEEKFPRKKDTVLDYVEWIMLPNRGFFDDGTICGHIDHKHKTVGPGHGYYYPNVTSKALMNIAKQLGYKYEDENWEREQERKRNKKKNNIQK